MTIFYNGTDITENVTVEMCEHDSYLSGKADTLYLKMDNSDGKWTAWTPAVGDTVRVTEGNADTGIMYVNSVQAVQSSVALTAASIPEPTAIRSRSWENANLAEILSRIAADNSLNLKSYGIQNFNYSYLTQDRQDDFTFLSRLLALEGYSFLVYDGTIIVYSLDYMEALPKGSAVLVADSEAVRITDLPYYGRCEINNGGAGGSYTEDKELPVVRYEARVAIDSIGQGERFAKGFLQYANTMRKHGVFYSDDLRDGIMAGSKTTLNHVYWPEAAIIVTHVRHEYVEGESKIWFRKARES